GVAARNERARRPWFSVVAFGIQQALHRRAAWPRHRRSACGIPGRDRLRHHARLPDCARPRRAGVGARVSHDRGNAVSIVLVQGSAPVLRDREVQRVISELLSDADRSFGLDDHPLASRRRAAATEEEQSDEPVADGTVELPAFAAIATALQSPPFMTASRVVVVREIGNLTSEQGQWLAGWIAEPLDGVHLVLVVGGGRTPAALDKRVKANAEIVGPKTEQTSDVLQQELKDAHLKLAPKAVTQIAEHLGDDAGRVPELVELIHSTYGDDAELDLDAVEQYLGDLGTAGRFDLTNAIDRGDVAGALETA